MKHLNQKMNQSLKGFSAPMAVMGVFVLGVIGLFMLAQSPNDPASPASGTPKEGQNVSVVDGKQIIELRAKGGYQPAVSQAKAGIPTVLKVNTIGTFDCSSSLRIPSMNISQMLPASGSTEIALGDLPVGTLKGTCSMGMYPFEIDVQA